MLDPDPAAPPLTLVFVGIGHENEAPFTEEVSAMLVGVPEHIAAFEASKLGMGLTVTV